MKRRGSMTIFAALNIMLVASVLFTLLEAARVQEECRVTKLTTDASLESLFAGYDRQLWDSWRLLARSAGATESQLSFEEMKEEFRELSEASLNPSPKPLSASSGNLLRAKTKSFEIQTYMLMTDGSGQAFENAVCTYMRKGVPAAVAQKIKEQYERQQSLDEVDVDTAVSNAQDGICQAKKEAGNASQAGDQAETPSEIKENPLEVVASLKKKGILSLLVDDPEQLSGKEIELKNTVSHRKLSCGNEDIKNANGWYEKILVHQYYANYFNDFLSPDKNGALQYEREYLLAGKKSDIANLKSCVNKILLLRESGNFLYLMQDSGKQAEALAAATVLAGASANPAIIEAVQYGILIAWAYVESLLDLRSLLSGEKISLVKNSAEWTTDLDSLAQCATTDLKAISCDKGMTYSEYLNMLLYIKNSEKTAYRAMDLQELSLRTQEGYENFHMDHMVLSMGVTVEYEFTNVFLSLVTLRDLGKTKFSTTCSGEYSYITKKS